HPCHAGPRHVPPVRDAPETRAGHRRAARSFRHVGDLERSRVHHEPVHGHLRPLSRATAAARKIAIPSHGDLALPRCDASSRHEAGTADLPATGVTHPRRPAHVSEYSGPEPPSGGVSRPPFALIAPHCTQFEGVTSTVTNPSPTSRPTSYTFAGHIHFQA